LLFDLDEDVAAVAVGVDEVVLHEHFEEGLRAQPGNHLVEGMLVELVVGDWVALHEGFN
jgi:hypothetical protein